MEDNNELDEFTQYDHDRVFERCICENASDLLCSTIGETMDSVLTDLKQDMGPVAWHYRGPGVVKDLKARIEKLVNDRFRALRFNE